MIEEIHHKRKGLYTPELEKSSCGVGLICNISGISTRYIVDSALTVLENMEHRGAYGAEKNTGDGAGILVQLPHVFFKTLLRAENVKVPDIGKYGVGMFFFPKDPILKRFCKSIIRKYIHIYQMTTIHTREVPVDNSMIGSMAKSSEPDMEQWFVEFKDEHHERELEKRLFFLRSSILNDAYSQDLSLIDDFYITSFSSKTIVYKGQLSATQLRQYFLDLKCDDFTSAVAIVHSRFSTNTIPKWKLAQPFRCISHNGEINTIQGNINWWQAREQQMNIAEGFDQKLKNVLPICDPYISDSGNFDNVAEFLLKSGRSLPHTLMMMIPEAWQNDDQISENKRAFYNYHDAIMEPWDGPASICFTDGTIVGAVLDRNGLRPSRYVVTDDDVIVLASEAGCLAIDQSKVVKKSRLQPGKMLVVDLKQHRVISDEEVKDTICNRYPYNDWINKNQIHIDKLEGVEDENDTLNFEYLRKLQIAFGITNEDERLILNTMAKQGKEPIGSMGADIPLAILSKIAQHPSNYFKQQFAQVTNPPLDSLREKFYMSLKTYLGGSGRVIKVGEEDAKVIRLDSPILSSQDFKKLKQINVDGFSFTKVSLLYSTEEGIDAALSRINNEVEMAAFDHNIICLSDFGVDQSNCAIPTLLAIGSIHHFLIARGKRKALSLIVEGGDIWETHHFATLMSYGADAIYPYMAYNSCRLLALNSDDVNLDALLHSYKSAAEKGLLKVMSKLGISTTNSYKGAQTFEALGVANGVIDKCFNGTISRISGICFKGFEKELLAKHELAFNTTEYSKLPDLGLHQWKRRGEYHLFNPKSIHLLQHSTKLNDYSLYKLFAKEIDQLSYNASTLRSYLRIKDKSKRIPIDQVEPVESIMKRFATGAMSFGSISHEAHSMLAIAMNRIGGKSNSGEGGEDEQRFDILKNGDSMNSAIKQVASGRFGVTINYLANAEEIQIKMAQGAKPGEGGQLPGHKVDQNIAHVRKSTPGVGLISPPPHHDIYSIEDLAQLIFDLKNANRKARISVKLVSKMGVGVIAAGVTKAHAEHILISGADGGTGASPLSSIRHTGLPWELGLSETHQTLVKNKLRDRVTLQADGQIRTGRDLAVATILGAEEWGVATAALVVEGCILMRKCHLNTCPVGIATQDPQLRKLFDGKVEHLVNYFRFLAEHLREILASLGISKVNDLVGRTDLLEVVNTENHWKTAGLNLEALLFQFDPGKGQSLYSTKQQEHGLESVLDTKLIGYCQKAIAGKDQISGVFSIKSTDRAVGTMLSNKIAKVYGSAGMNDSSINIHFRGSAGQSFGAFLAKGIDFKLEGEANDYVGKGLSGGQISILPDSTHKFDASQQVIVGNVSLYGATSGNVYINGMAGDRFGVRNSGAKAVVEGIGDNGCEYMTGGAIIILGEIGKNFAAGMSGGYAYIYNLNEKGMLNINQESIVIVDLDEEDKQFLFENLQLHYKLTKSRTANSVINNWTEQKYLFKKIFPKELKAVLELNNKHKAYA